MKKLFNISKRRNRIFSDYPCSIYLHNALKFISDNKPDVAYEEICHAILRAGDKLSIEEKEIFDKIKEKYRIK